MTDTLPFSLADAAPVTGNVEMTKRGFREQAQAAMRGDVMRALVELVTNSDDALRRAKRDGNIRIAAEHSRNTLYNRIVVLDDGPGMTHGEMEEGLLKAGNRTSVESDRGFWGFGAKDASAFGRVEFRSITADGDYSRMVIHKDGRYEDYGSRPADDVLRADMGIARTGMRVTVYVQRPIAVPQHKTLVDRLTRHVQLRDIFSHQTASLADLSNPDRPPMVLRYQPPDWIKNCLDETFAIPGYPGAEARLVVYRCQSRLADERTPWRDSGILVVGRHAIHQATYFGFDNRSGALWFTGRLECPVIDDLQADYDRREELHQAHPKTNFFPLLTRTRDGLDPTHPFTVALKAQVDARLSALVEDVEKEEAQQGEVESEDTKRRLRECARAMEEEFRRVSEDREVDVDTGPQDNPPGVKPAALEVIPPSIRLDPGGDEHRVLIRAWKEAWGDDEPLPDPPLVTIRSDSSAIVISPDELELTPDPRHTGRLRGTVTIASTAEEEDPYTATVALGGRTFEVIINVAEEEEPEPPPPPQRLEFRPARNSMTKGRVRRLRIRAPRELSSGREATAIIRSTAGIGAPEQVTLELAGTDEARWWEGRCKVQALLPGTWRLRAELGGQVATCQIVVQDTEALRFDFKARREVPRPSEGRHRWETVEKVNLCLILTGHHSLARYFALRGGKLDPELETERMLLFAEVIADAMATFTLVHTRDSGPPPGSSGSVAQQYVLFERYKLMDRYLKVAQRHVAIHGVPVEEG